MAILFFMLQGLVFVCNISIMCEFMQSSSHKSLVSSTTSGRGFVWLLYLTTMWGKGLETLHRPSCHSRISLTSLHKIIRGGMQ